MKLNLHSNIEFRLLIISIKVKYMAKKGNESYFNFICVLTHYSKIRNTVIEMKIL